MTGNNNTLSLSVQTFSGNTTLIWSLHGNHGNIWKTGVITYRPNEILAVGKAIAFSVCLFVFPVCLFALSFLFIACFQVCSLISVHYLILFSQLNAIAPYFILSNARRF
jgi:hypothetical protein